MNCKFWFTSSALFMLAFALPIKAFGQQNCADLVLQETKPRPLPDSEKELLPWVWEQNGRTNRKLRASSNFEAIGTWLRKSLDKNYHMKTYSIDSDTQLDLYDRGLGKPTELVLTQNGTEKVLFSNYSLKKNGTFTFIDFKPSPDGQYVAMLFVEKGSTDVYRLILLDIQTGKTGLDVANIDSRDLSWITPSELLFEIEGADKKTYLVRHVVKRPRHFSQEKGYLIDSRGNWTAIMRGERIEFIHNNGAKVEIFKLPKGERISSIIGEVNSELLFKTTGPNGDAVVKVSKSGARTVEELKAIRPPDGRAILSAKVSNQFLLVSSLWAGKTLLEVYDLDGKSIADVPIPDCCALGSMTWKTPGTELRLTLESAVAEDRAFTYNIKTKTWSEPDINEAMLTSNNTKFVSEVVEVASDNVNVPMRITRRADLKTDQSNPVFIKVYGGFFLTGSIVPSFDPVMMEFLRRGGIFAAPALRGGNERGKAWHLNGSKQNKVNTMKDLIASAKWMVNSNWTTPNRIITNGSSNGGLVVASAALLAPEAFGLVIPNVGVHNLLKKEEMDPDFGPGWAFEYGDSRNPEDRRWLQPISPVHLAKAPQGPKFLIFVGRQDSRVNPKHSYQLASELLKHREHGADVHLISLNNSGHYFYSRTYQNFIGWRANVIMWTFIFDHLKWTF